MESRESATAPPPAAAIPFKAKKPLDKTPKKSSALPLPSDLLLSKTPEKSNPSSRLRNQNSALSIGEVRRVAAHQLQKSNLNRSDAVRKSDLRTEDLRLEVADKLQRCNDDKQKKNLGKSIKLPEKYDLLCEFFNAMVSSIQLLRLRQLSTTFTNIFTKVESLTDRRFTVNHLAQLTHILPEAIKIEKIRVRDEETNCMKEDFLISLDVDAIKDTENGKGFVGFPQLKKVFRARIMQYYENHPEGDDIPERAIPQLFYPPKQDLHLIVDQTYKVSAASHIPPSFCRLFSYEVSSLEVEDETNNNESPASDLKERKASEASPAQWRTSNVPETPSKQMYSFKTEGSRFTGTTKIHGTPASLVSTPVRLMAATPSLKPERRCYMSPIDDASASPNKLLRRPTRMSLNFDASESDVTVEDQPKQLVGPFVEKDDLDFLPESLLKSVREKEQRIKEEQDPAISQAKRRHKLMANLPRLFDMIHLLFQSINRPVITKEELICKIVAGHLDIVDRREVEEQLKLLQESAPGYISEKLCLSGDVLIRLNRSSSPESIRAKLVDAV